MSLKNYGNKVRSIADGPYPLKDVVANLMDDIDSRATALEDASAFDGSYTSLTDKPDLTAFPTYSKGTFTMALRYGSGGTGMTYTGHTGKWWKINDIVFWDMYFQLLSKGIGGSGNIFLDETGLPNAPLITDHQPIQIASWSGFAVSLLPAAKWIGNTLQLNKLVAGAAGPTQLISTDINDNMFLGMNGFYKFA